jgi:hypothetical protein
MEERYLAVSKLGDLSIQVNRIATFFHAFFGIGMGTSLIYSYITGRQSASDSYVYLEAVPGWPASVGAVLVIAGLILAVSLGVGQINRTRFCLAAGGFALQSLALGFYAALFSVGTFVSGTGLVGPQWVYYLAAGLAGMRAWFSISALRVVVTMGE